MDDCVRGGCCAVKNLQLLLLPCDVACAEEVWLERSGTPLCTSDRLILEVWQPPKPLKHLYSS